MDRGSYCLSKASEHPQLVQILFGKVFERCRKTFFKKFSDKKIQNQSQSVKNFYFIPNRLRNLTR